MSPITLKEKKLAIVLLDIIGSTAFVQKYGAQKAAEWFQYHDRMTRNLCYKFKGREIDRSDGFLMSFDTAIDAVNFALHYQKTIPQKTKLDTRIGIHWGKVIEVQQDELYALMGAKGVELEGIGKNIAARTMSICGPKQVLLTKEAFSAIKNRTNHWTPKGTRYVMVGLYKFKGVAETQVIYAVGESIESLQTEVANHKSNVRVIDIFSGAFKSNITKNRDDYSKLIEPKEVSTLIVSQILDRNSYIQDKIYIKRDIY